MNIVVLIAGVLDPKWPIALTPGALPARQIDRVIMSPFDEAALEIALRIRDAHPATEVRAFVAGGEAGAKLARAVAAFNIAEVSTMQLDCPWDQASVANQLTQVCGHADLVLLGREFGDLDDGLVPPLLAGLLGAEFFGRTQFVEAKDEVRLMREFGSFEEWLGVKGRLVASVTNDRLNWLRKPLMKNVMLARQASIGLAEVRGPAPSGLEIDDVAELAGTRATTACAMVGGSPEEQARTLASILLEVQA
jgi:electron transfer flavoprotein beta subunit